MSEKNCNVTLSDFSVYQKASSAHYVISHKSIADKLKSLFKHVRDYDFWVSENNQRIKEKIKQKNMKRINSAKPAVYKLSSASYKNFNI